jgi:hypothetical protein
MKKMIIPALVLAVIAATPLHAAGAWYAGIQLGAEVLTDSHDDVDDSVAFGVYGGYHLDRMVSLEANLTTASHDIDGPGDPEIDITSVLFGPRLTGQAGRNLNLYAGTGLGIYFLDYEVRDYDDSETETGLYLGAGMEFPLQRDLNLGLDFKYHLLFDDDAIDSDIVTLLVRVGFDL